MYNIKITLTVIHHRKSPNPCGCNVIRCLLYGVTIVLLLHASFGEWPSSNTQLSAYLSVTSLFLSINRHYETKHNLYLPIAYLLYPPLSEPINWRHKPLTNHICTVYASFHVTLPHEFFALISLRPSSQRLRQQPSRLTWASSVGWTATVFSSHEFHCNSVCVVCLYTYTIRYATCNSEPAEVSAVVRLLQWSIYRMCLSLHTDRSSPRRLQRLC
jgi:hypothetical protein